MSTLVGYIPTAAGENALNAAIDHSARTGSALTILNIVRDDRTDDLRHASEKELSYAAQTARRAGIRTVETRTVHVANGHKLPRALIAEAKRSGAELIVVGARHSSNIPQHLMGLTLQSIIADAPCSVLVA